MMDLLAFMLTMFHTNPSLFFQHILFFSKPKKMGNFWKSFFFLIQNLTNFAIILENIAKFFDVTKLKNNTLFQSQWL